MIRRLTLSWTGGRENAGENAGTDGTFPVFSSIQATPRKLAGRGMWGQTGRSLVFATKMVA